MAGATIFVMYQDGNGNVTVSVRDGGQGHVEPLVDSTLMAGLEVLSGSGVVGDTMVANIKCASSFSHCFLGYYLCANRVEKPFFR